MDDIAKIKEQIIAVVTNREGELVAVQDKVQAIIDLAATDFNKRTKELEEKYNTNENSSSSDFMKEFRLLEEDVKSETQKKLDTLLHEVEENIL